MAAAVIAVVAVAAVVVAVQVELLASVVGAYNLKIRSARVEGDTFRSRDSLDLLSICGCMCPCDKPHPMNIHCGLRRWTPHFASACKRLPRSNDPKDTVGRQHIGQGPGSCAAGSAGSVHDIESLQDSYLDKE